MIKIIERVLTPTTTGMSRADITEQICLFTREKTGNNWYADEVRRHMEENPDLWPVIVTRWSNEGIYPYGEEHRPLQKVAERVEWREIAGIG